MFDTGGMTERPEWWQYPEQCHHGHEWGPGLVTVGWMPCDCPEAQAENMGHLWVRCHAAEGCSSIWYRPAHSPSPEARCRGAALVLGIGGRCCDGPQQQLQPT
jgi:hypothetical protein